MIEMIEFLHTHDTFDDNVTAYQIKYFPRNRNCNLGLASVAY